MEGGLRPPSALGSTTPILYKSPNLGHLFIWKSESDILSRSPQYGLVSQDEALEWLIEHRLNTEEMCQKIGIKLEEYPLLASWTPPAARALSVVW